MILRILLALLALGSVSARAQFAPDYLIHPTSTCSASQFVQYQTLGSPATCGGISAVSPLTTKGDIFVFGSANDRLPVGTNNYVLTPDSAQSLGLKWQSESAHLDAVFSSTQGALLERESSTWGALAPGSSTNYVLKSGGAGANNSWGYSPGIAYLGNVVVAGSAVTTLTYSGTSISTDGFYFFNIAITNTSASTSNYSIYLAGDTTATNYYSERAQASGAAWTLGNANDAVFGSLTAGSYGAYVGFIMRDLNKTRLIIFASQRSTTGLLSNYNTIEWQNTGDPTSITISGSVASSIGIGSVLNLGRFHP